jgi:hypothetical protein
MLEQSTTALGISGDFELDRGISVLLDELDDRVRSGQSAPFASES